MSSSVAGVQVPIGAAAAEDVLYSQEEGEIAILTSQETVGPSSQRFAVETPSRIVGAMSPPKVVAEGAIALGGEPVETAAVGKVRERYTAKLATCSKHLQRNQSSEVLFNFLPLIARHQRANRQ